MLSPRVLAVQRKLHPHILAHHAHLFAIPYLRGFPLLVSSRYVSAVAKTSPPPPAKSPIAPSVPHLLRPYQEECIRECLRLFNDGIRRQVVSLPVGSGKTV